MRRILFLAWAEVLHIVRDRATIVQVILTPVIQLLILSNAATFEIRDTPTYVVDFDHTSTSRALVQHFAVSGHFRVAGHSASQELANEALLRGDVTMVLTVPRDFEQSIVREHTARVQLAVNAEKGSAAGIVQSYAARILTAYAQELGTRIQPSIRSVRGPGAEPIPAPGGGHIELREHGWYNASLNYKHYMVPGILVALVTMIGTLLTAQNIAREKEICTLEQLNVTPITRGQFITAKLLPFWVLGLLELSIGLAVGRLAFGIPMRGSLLLLFAAAGIYLIVALAVGLWISTVVDTQQQAMFVTSFIIMVYLLMSGLFTPIDSMPHWVQLLAQLNPVRHFVTISRAVLVKGAGIAEIGKSLLILAGFAAAVLTMAIRQHSKRTT